MNATIQFTVPGEVVGKGRPRFARRGKFVQTYTPEKTASYEAVVKQFAAQAMAAAKSVGTLDAALITGPVSVYMQIRVHPPASWSKKKRSAALSGDVLPTKKPDIDNVEKGIFDALNGVVWEDDKQVVHVTKTKQYAEAPGVLVAVTALEQAGA